MHLGRSMIVAAAGYVVATGPVAVHRLRRSPSLAEFLLYCKILGLVLVCIPKKKSIVSTDRKI